MTAGADGAAPLAVEDVSVRFGGVQALSEVSLQVDAGSVTGLIGPNGAGKTTLFNVVSGLVAPTSGRVLLSGRDVTHDPTYRRARLGVARTYQRLELFGSLSVRENVLVGAELRREWDRSGPDPGATTDRLLGLIGIADVAEARADTLSTGTSRLVELARALASGPRVLLLDEPSSGLDDRESESFGRLLLRLADEGLAILLVEHDMDLVMSVCRHIWVLDFGRILTSGSAAQIRESPAVQEAYLGTAAAAS
ncbi:MAG TPA: ABC transporter ATP-binding protein [Acidimicrobiales bacterium]|nr:ABC transporter ATP-binding protein [Acidimicrobiales bacterium]